MQINFKVTYADGSATDISTASVADQVAFERHFDRSIATLSKDFRLADMCWLAWHGLKRTNRASDDFDQWLPTVENVEIADSGIVPLETSQPTG